MIDQTGLVWEPSIWGSKPKWTVEPSLEAVAKTAYQHLNLSDAEVENASIEFLAQGAFNKVYAITCSKGLFVMRVTLPVDPGHKVTSEVATINLIRKKTSIPVPRILAYDSSHRNHIRFEFMVMDRVNGISLAEAFLQMPWDAKIKVVDSMANYLAQMFQLRSVAIGNAYHESDYALLKNPSALRLEIMPDYVIGRLVSMDFFWDKRIIQDTERGPFYTSKQWLDKWLFFARSDAEAVIANSSDKDEIKVAKFTLGLITGLLELMPKLFHEEGFKNGPEWCCMHHDDLTGRNILLNRDGVVQGILDWECVSYVPLWKACRIPAFLRSCDRSEKPVQHAYGYNDDGTPSDGYL